MSMGRASPGSKQVWTENFASSAMDRALSMRFTGSGKLFGSKTDAYMNVIGPYNL